MFDRDGEFMFDHDLEEGAWDGHAYGCSFPGSECSCEFDERVEGDWLDDIEFDSNDPEQFIDTFFSDDEPTWLYHKGPNHNPPGISATGMTVACEDGMNRCPCVCHCSWCSSGVDPDRNVRSRSYL